MPRDERYRPIQFSLRELIELGFLAVLERLDEMEQRMATDFSEIEAKVAAQSGVVDSAVALLKAIHDELLAAGTDQTALTNLAASIEANTSKLSDAVAANPDPEPAPPADTTPPPAETGTNPDGSTPPDAPTDGTGAADIPAPTDPAPVEQGLNPDGSEPPAPGDWNIPEGTDGVTENFISAGESSPDTGGQITPEQ